MSHFVAVPASQVDARPSGPERRRYPRVRAIRPAYVRLQGRMQGLAVDLNQILDLSEYGLGIQTAGRLELNRTLDVGLDLSPAGVAIPAKAQAVWLDDQGRAGLRFEPLSDDALRAVHEWLALSIGQASSQTAAPKKIPTLEVPTAALPTQGNGVAAAAMPLLSVTPSAIAELEPELNLIVQRAQAYTGASGAALALRQGQGMVCCATCGADAPALGMRINTESGLTGETLRTGRTLVCSDTRLDARVDRMVCEDLGIRSILALPILVNNQAAGLVEVFSPQPNLLVEGDGEALSLLLSPLFAALQAKISPLASVDARQKPATDPGIPSRATPVPPAPGGFSSTDSYPVSVVRPATPPRSFYWRALLALGVCTILVGAGWLVYSQSATLLSLWKDNKPVQPPAPLISVSAPRPTPDLSTVDGLRSLAERGDPAAQFALGAKYANGSDVPRDDEQAAHWFTQAAEHGHVGAQAILGACYWVGRGVPKDVKQAYFWSLLASAGGDEISRARLKSLASQMRRSDVLAVVQQADEWMRSHSAPPAR